MARTSKCRQYVSLGLALVRATRIYEILKVENKDENDVIYIYIKRFLPKSRGTYRIRDKCSLM
jgi:hypothetical protein